MPTIVLSSVLALTAIGYYFGAQLAPSPPAERAPAGRKGLNHLLRRLSDEKAGLARWGFLVRTVVLGVLMLAAAIGYLIWGGGTDSGLDALPRLATGLALVASAARAFFGYFAPLLRVPAVLFALIGAVWMACHDPTPDGILQNALFVGIGIGAVVLIADVLELIQDVRDAW